MPYTTTEELVESFSLYDLARLTSDPSGIVLDEYKVATAIESAAAVIDSYLGSRYHVPFTYPCDPIIKKISVDLAFSSICEYHYHLTSLPQTIAIIHDNAIKLLELIQSGQLSLIIHTEGNAKVNIISNKSGVGRRFSPGQLEHF